MRLVHKREVAFAIDAQVPRNHPYAAQLAMLLNLTLFKLADASDDVRTSAIRLLRWMSTRFFRTQQETMRLARVRAVA